MAILFKYQWSSAEGGVFQTSANGEIATDHRGRKLYNLNFLVWCRNLEPYSGNQIATGIKMVEALVAENAKQGDETWPPSYAAFGAYCDAKRGDHAACHRYYQPPLLIEDDSTKARRLAAAKVGRARLKAIMNGTEEPMSPDECERITKQSYRDTMEKFQKNPSAFSSEYVR